MPSSQLLQRSVQEDFRIGTGQSPCYAVVSVDSWIIFIDIALMKKHMQFLVLQLHGVLGMLPMTDSTIYFVNGHRDFGTGRLSKKSG